MASLGAPDPGSAGGHEKQIGQRSEDEFGSAEGRGFHGENDRKLAQKTPGTSAILMVGGCC